MTHGFAGYKAGKGDSNVLTKPDVVSVTSQLSEDLYPSFEDFGNATFIHAGMPRLDYFFEKNDGVRNKINSSFRFSQYKKVFLWMPTFRESEHRAISEDYLNTETHLPILTSRRDLQEFQNLLEEHQLLMILKIHPLQRDLPVFRTKFPNILFLRDEELHSINVQLYQFIVMTDALITDYSSISADYMLLDKPIIFTLDDYEEYRKSRGGFIPEDPIHLWAGAHVYDKNEFYGAISRVAEGYDDHREERHKLLPLFYDHIDGKASERICSYLSL